MKKLIIIPAYNEYDNLPQTLRDVREHAPDYDYVIIDDCSTDETFSVCREQGFSVIHLPVNLGIGGAVQTGFMYAREKGYDIAVQIDGDGQHNARYLKEMEQKMAECDADMVIGSRFIKKEGFQSSMARQMGIRYFTWLIRALTGVRITDPTSGMRMVNREMIKMFAADYPKDYPEPECVVRALKQWKRVTELPVMMNARQMGVSSISPVNSIYYMIKVTLAVILAWF